MAFNQGGQGGHHGQGQLYPAVPLNNHYPYQQQQQHQLQQHQGQQFHGQQVVHHGQSNQYNVQGQAAGSYYNTPMPPSASQSVLRYSVPIPDTSNDKDELGPLGRASEAVRRGMTMDDEVTVDLKLAVAAASDKPGE